MCCCPLQIIILKLRYKTKIINITNSSVHQRWKQELYRHGSTEVIEKLICRAKVVLKVSRRLCSRYIYVSIFLEEKDTWHTSPTPSRVIEISLLWQYGQVCLLRAAFAGATKRWLEEISTETFCPNWNRMPTTLWKYMSSACYMPTACQPERVTVIAFTISHSCWRWRKRMETDAAIEEEIIVVWLRLSWWVLGG